MKNRGTSDQDELQEEPQCLWRVASLRCVNETIFRHTSWHTSECDAKRSASLVEDRGGKVLSVLKYVLESGEVAE